MPVAAQSLQTIRMPFNSERTTTAEALLRQPERFPSLPRRDRYHRRLLLWQFPSFVPYSSWALYVERDACWVRRLEHDRTRGLALDAADPDIYGAEARIDPAEANELLAGFTVLSLPMFLPSARFGLDGVRYGIAFGDDWCGTEVTWWSDPDEAWRPLVEAYERTVVSLEAKLPASTLRAQA